MANDIDAPLTSRQARAKSPAGTGILSRLPIGAMAFGLLVVVLAIPSIWVLLVDDPDGGRPVGEIAVGSARQGNELADSLTIPEAEPEGESTVEIIDPVAPSPDDILEAAIDPDLPDPSGTALGELLEETQHGAIPRIGDDGTRPLDAYARPSVGPAGAAGRPRIALIVTGLGLSAETTNSAIAQLPDNVTLGFAPYGDLTASLAAGARAGGHEIMLEVPMEPFDYPQNDPGPQTLVTGQPVRANLDRLFWLMSRIGGYVGLVNHMGARFTASAVDFGPVMEEVGLRGLGYLDDGSSNRSLAQQLARSNGIEFSRVDVALDNQPSRAAILTQFERLESLARTRGYAVGMSSALPISLRMIAEWAGGAEEAGFLLVPVSAVIGESASGQ